MEDAGSACACTTHPGAEAGLAPPAHAAAGPCRRPAGSGPRPLPPPRRPCSQWVPSQSQALGGTQHTSCGLPAHAPSSAAPGASAGAAADSTAGGASKCAIKSSRAAHVGQDLCEVVRDECNEEAQAAEEGREGKTVHGVELLYGRAQQVHEARAHHHCARSAHAMVACTQSLVQC